MRKKARVPVRDGLMEALVRGGGWCTLGLLLLLVLFLAGAARGLQAPWQVFLGTVWQPVAQPPQFGALPLLWGTLLTTTGAGLLALPLSYSAAVFLAEVAPVGLRRSVQIVLELLAAIPAVVLGFLGATLLAPAVAAAFALPAGYTALTGGIVLAVMIIPTVTLAALAALDRVPHQVREASCALGATRWETICRAILPACRRGLLTAAVLGLGRATGETMAVLMVTGNVPQLALTPLAPVQTVTAALAGEMGEAAVGSQHYRALFAIGLQLFLLSLGFNWLAAQLVRCQD